MAELRVGDVVIDRESEDEAARLIVLDASRGRAGEVYIEALDASVADVNAEYPTDDPVVECVHEEWLERHAGNQWEDWDPAAFADQLEAFVAEWNIPLSTYDYPASRLERVDTGRRGGGQSSLDQW